MVAQVQSSSNTDVEYAVTVERGQVVRCTCIAQFYHPGKPCRHMKSTQEAINAEFAKAARFLAVCAQVQGMQETWKCQYEMAFDSRF